MVPVKLAVALLFRCSEENVITAEEKFPEPLLAVAVRVLAPRSNTKAPNVSVE